MKPLVFMSGQTSSVVTLCAIQGWHVTTMHRQATSNVTEFTLEGLSTKFRGGLMYASHADSESSKKQMEALDGFPVWPDPKKLLRLVDRHVVAQECVSNGFFEFDPCEVVQPGEAKHLIEGSATVLKVGNEHSGRGINLVPAGHDFPSWEGPATIQPFFQGRSVRVLHVGTAIFFLETVNESNWIKNSHGGEMVLFDSRAVPDGMMDHSYRVRDHFDLEVCGNDYIVSPDGSFHFLEFNQFPGLNSDLLGENFVNDFLSSKMKEIEKIVDSTVFQ